MYHANRHKKLLTFLRIGCLIYGYRSLDANAARWKRWLMELRYWLQFANDVLGLVAAVHGLVCCYQTVSQLIKSVVDVVFMIEILFNAVYVRCRRKKFQRLTMEMEQFFATTSWVNLNRPEISCYILTTIFFTGCVISILIPLFTKNQTTPLFTVYFSVPRDVYWGRNIIYTLNIIQMNSAASAVLLDILMVFIMWHVACKFSSLTKRFTVSNEKKMKLWIKQHQNALSYAKEINSVIAPLAVKSTFGLGLAIIISGLVATRNLNLLELSKFFIITIFSVLKFIAYSWIADTMSEKADNVAWKIYDSPWIYTSPKTRKVILMIMRRSQKSIAIHMAGFLSAWTLKFCYQVLYTNITYLTTLRAVVRV